MNTKQIINTLNQLPTSYPSERTEQRAQTAIEETAELIAPILTERGLQISKGSSSPSSRRSYARIYLERVGNTSHDSRHAEYQSNVIRTWEWEVMSGGYMKPMSCKAICTFCDQLQAELLD